METDIGFQSEKPGIYSDTGFVKRFGIAISIISTGRIGIIKVETKLEKLLIFNVDNLTTVTFSISRWEFSGNRTTNSSEI